MFVSEKVSSVKLSGGNFVRLFGCDFTIAYFDGQIIITIMFFLSKGRIPIYDQFTHKAVKAIYFEKKPKDIYVGPAPLKSSITDAVNLLMEYMWYLEEIFGRHNISRSEDQALWAYGHVRHKGM